MSKKVVKKSATKADTKTGKEKVITGKSGKKYVVVTRGADFWNPETIGEQIEGEFLENMEFKGGKFSKLKNKKGDPISIKPVILTTEGKQVALPDTTNVVKFFEDVEKGQFVCITYGGKQIKKGQEHKKNPESFHVYEFAKEMK